MFADGYSGSREASVVLSAGLTYVHPHLTILEA